MATATYFIECDFSANGVFTDVGEDLTSRVLEIRSMSYGRDYASQLRGRSTAGSLEIVLNNASGDYNSFNTASPLTGLILPNRKVRVRTTAPVAKTLWTGFLDSIQPIPSLSGLDVAILRASGRLAQIGAHDVSLAVATNVLTGTAINNILTEIGLAAADYLLDTGQTTIVRHWTDRKNVLTALREIEESEGGFIVEVVDGKVAFEDRFHRLKSPHTISQATFSDAAGAARTYSAIQQENPLKEIFNVLECVIERFTVGTLAALWTLSESGVNSPSIAVGQSLVFWASYPNPDSATNAKMVDAWTTPVVTTDFLVNSAADGSGTNISASIAVAVSKFDTAMKITLTNNHASLNGFVTLLQARGTPVTADDPVMVKSEDATSQTRYGKRTYRNPGRFVPTTTEGQNWADTQIAIYKDPIPVLSITVQGSKDNTHLTEVLTREVSERITLRANNTGANGTNLGINEDFFIERITHRVSASRIHTTTYELSPASAFGGFFILDTSLLDSVDRLSY